MFCTRCGTQLSGEEKFCTKCGAPVTPAEPLSLEPEDVGEGNKSRKALIIIIAFLACLLFFGITAGGAVMVYTGSFGGFFGSGHENGGQEDAKEVHGGKKSEDKQEESSEHNEEEEETEENEETAEDNRPISIQVRQVDNTNFPKVTFYATITDENGEIVENLTEDDFTVTEISMDGQISETTVDRVEQVIHSDRISIDMIMDASGSMDGMNKMPKAKEACTAFINQMNLAGGDQVEIISFDDYVYLQQYFTSQYDSLIQAVDGIGTGGATALYDALYAGLMETYNQSGAKCVIAFTDGMENASSYTFEDVVNMAQSTGIPVFIIGIGSEPDAAVLGDLANQCFGGYYSADETELETILEDVYTGIYREQQGSYVFEYTSSDLSHTGEFREIQITTSEESVFTGEYKKEYIPVSDLTGGFSADYAEKDYMIDDSASREVTEADLQDMSLAELRIARNEIFARYGRQFKDSMLNKWFYSKNWYLNVPSKYSPEDFDRLSPSPMSFLEKKNVEFIMSYEQNLMEHGDIYPESGVELLSDYDLALSKPVLRQALEQMNTYPQTEILQQNIARVQEAIAKEDITY